MNADAFDPLIDELAPQVLHGAAGDAEKAALSHLLENSPENRRRFLDHASLHAMLVQEAKAGAFADSSSEFFQRMETVSPAKPKRLLRFWLPAAAALVAACLVVVTLLPTSASAALDRVIAAMGQPLDRTYRIEVLETGETNAPSRDGRGRFPASSHLDDATLWLRGAGQFVLRQTLPDGQTRFVGSNGKESWSVREGEAAHISKDPERFGGGVLAKRRELAFLDLHGQLDELKALYQIEWLERPDDGPWKLRGLRKSADQGGPREVELWFDHNSGLLERMILRQLPRGNGGPRSIAVELESTSTLPADFYEASHPHHTGP